MSGSFLPPLKTEEIAKLIPHHGNMCLLSEVRTYDQHHIFCLANSHRLLDNPLRENGLLRSVCGIEYAAQAMAIHGRLSTTQGLMQARGGRLASVRTAQFYVVRLDDIQEDLEIHATLLLGDDSNMIYEFNVAASGVTLLRGKATVILITN